MLASGIEEIGYFDLLNRAMFTRFRHLSACLKSIKSCVAENGYFNSECHWFESNLAVRRESPRW